MEERLVQGKNKLQAEMSKNVLHVEGNCKKKKNT
jgi:hypothetical protein